MYFNYRKVSHWQQFEAAVNLKMKLFIVFVIAGYFVEKGTTQICTHAHEKYQSCSNGCQTTCENYQNPPMCIAVCLPERAGCYCEAPYVRSDSGECVLTSQCETQTCTRLHEKYQSCSNGCQTTCKNYENPPICTQECSTALAGCYCEYPYVRNDAGECVETFQCKSEGTTQICTHAHEIYQSCSNGCQTTCGNYKNPPMCIAVCLPERAGCYCEAPYVRSDSGECVLTSQCETQTCTRLHEKYQSCSNGCQTTCKNYENPPICTQECSTALAGCYCEHPYVRNDYGECVETFQCKVVEPQQPYCKGRNEVYNPKGTLCPKTCATKDIMFKCSSETQPGCFCAPGYLRNSKNRCVLIANCC